MASVLVTGLIHVVSCFLVIGDGGIFRTNELSKLLTEGIAFFDGPGLRLVNGNFPFYRRQLTSQRPNGITGIIGVGWCIGKVTVFLALVHDKDAANSHD